MLDLDPPRHTRLRGLVNRAFTSRNVAELEPEISKLAHALIDRLPKRAELQKNFSESLPVMVIARLLGVQTEMCSQMLAWSHDMVAMYQAKRDRGIELRAARAAKEFTEFIQEEIARRRAAPSDDLISRLIKAEDRDGSSPMMKWCRPAFFCSMPATKPLPIRSETASRPSLSRDWIRPRFSLRKSGRRQSRNPPL